MARYIAFDVETPNRYNSRMSAIGIAVVEDGRIVDTFYSLVDPEQPFDWFNTQLTGIDSRAVRGAPTFPALWERIEPLMSSGVLVAHNAPFDLSVLARCLSDYGVVWRRTAEYVCTCRIGRARYPELPGHGLAVMAAHFGIPLDHHRALSDTEACAELLRIYCAQDPDLHLFRRTYDFSSLRTVRCF